MTTVRNIFIAMFVLGLVLLLGIKACSGGHHNTNNATQSASNNQPQQQQPQDLVEGSKTFDISSIPVRICLEGHWVATTPSGNITITTPDGIKFDGGKGEENYPTGWYVFEPKKENPAPSVKIDAIWYSPEKVRECS